MSELKAGKYQTYPEYRKVVSEWLSKIPQSWTISTLKHVARINMGQSPSSEDCNIEGIGIPFLQGNAEFGIKTPLEKQYCPIPKKIALEGELLFSVRAPVGALNLANKSFGIGRGLCSIRGNDSLSQSFLWWVLPSYKYQFDAIATGSTFEAISAEQVGNLSFALPNNEEQTQIANFLDHETAKIDTLIEKQQQLIKLLKEKRQAVISHAVTKGLNPNVPIKDSGVEWLGEVPEHWDVKRNKHLMEFVTSGSRGWAEYYSDDGPLFFRITNLTRDTVEPKLESIQNVKPPAGSEGERSKIRSGDLLISITADLGSVCVADDSVAGGFVSQHVSLCRPNSLVISSRWLAYFILSDAAKEQFIGSGYGGTKIQLSLEDIRELNIAYPPVSEQGEIALYIDTKLEKFALLMNRAESQVNLLQERRTALISAAVTGKIDVRNWEQPND
jgi:type I restriction enzyme S subunit